MSSATKLSLCHLWSIHKVASRDARVPPQLVKGGKALPVVRIHAKGKKKQNRTGRNRTEQTGKLRSDKESR
eukprot:scaffold51004_cov18-Tisochrysis_lutea.AAC.1